MAFQASLRFSGINTGWDTDTMVQSMMKAESMKLSKLQKSLMLDTYRQEQYRNVLSDLKTFQKDFLDVMKAGSVRAEGTFSSSLNVLDENGEKSNAVTIAGGDPSREYKIQVDQIATADLYESQNKIGGSISSAAGFQFDVSKIRAGTGYDFTLDGVSRRITFSEGDRVSGIQMRDEDGNMMSLSGTLTFDSGKIAIESDSGAVTELDEQAFMNLFNKRLGTTFGNEGVGAGAKQKVEAKLTSTGGLTFTTNGYHTGFTMANGNYSFASETGRNPANLGSRASLEFRVSAGNTTADIKVDTNGKTDAEIIKDLNTKLADAGLGDGLSAELVDGKVKLTNYSTADRVVITDGMNGNGSMAAMGLSDSVALAAGGGLSDLGITSGASAKFNTNASLGQIFGTSLTGENSFTINGTTFNFSASTRVSTIIDAVTASNIGVKMSYDSYTETFKLESTETGVVNKIEMSGALLTDNFGFGTTAKRAAQDSVATINGTTITRSSNEYSFEGVDWTLKKATEGDLTISSTTDTDKVLESIKGFVDGYNALVEKLRGQTQTMRPKSKGSYFDPLTDEERAEMKESDIKLWDEKAKTGLLYNDSILEGIESQLRSALNQSITLPDGSRLSLASIGIETTQDWSKGGMLEIRDETKLREAIEKNGSQIGALFTSTSEATGKGLAERVNDIVNNAISTNGPIAKKAGIAGTFTETNNEIFRRLQSQNDAIEELMEKLAAKEQQYYNKFAKIEAAMGQAQSQMQYVQSMFA